MADENAQAVAEGDGDANAGVNAAEAAGNQAQTNSGAAAKAPATTGTPDDGAAADARAREILRAMERGEEPFADADDDASQAGGTHEEATQREEGGEDEGAEATENEDAGGEDDDGAEEPAAEAAGKTKEPKRIKPATKALRELNDRVFALMKGGMTEQEAMAYALKQQAPAKAGEAEQQQEAAQESKDPVAEKQAELDDLQSKLDAAIDAYDTAEQKKLNRDIARVQRELTKAELAAENARQAGEQKRQEAELAVLDEVKNAMPEFLTEGTPLKRAADAIGETLPDAFFANPNWPKRLARLAWDETYPGEPMPGAEKTAKPAGRPAGVNGNGVRPVKNGTSAAALATGSGAEDGGGVLARALKAARGGEGSAEDIRAALRAIG